MSEKRLIDGDKVLQVTPEMVAELFAEMCSDDQARFFNHVAKVATTWPGPFCFQLQAITEEHGLTAAGRRVMQEIGDYSHWGIVPQIKREVDA